VTLTLIPPAVAGLSRDASILASLTVIATRADDLLALAEQKHVPAEQVRIDALRIRAMADDARRVLVQAHREMSQ
jgi:hypothetical protein